jgi:hypothetical protein
MILDQNTLPSFDHPFFGLFQPFFPLVFALDRQRLPGSLVTRRWRKADSNRWSHFRVSTPRHRPDVAERQQRDPAPSPNSAVATITLFGQSSRRKRQRAQFHDKEKAPSVWFPGSI